MDNEKGVSFSGWRRWDLRERLHDPRQDVPVTFDLIGIYLLARFEGELPKQTSSERYLHPGVVYIGMSTAGITRRLDKFHRAVKKYRENFADSNGELLYCCNWSPWSNGEATIEVRTRIRLIERMLIHEYVQKFGHLPACNAN